ncbi:MAG TPA: VOC family protein [Anaerolineaceae bacterium]|nr:VOC family protein [Anaerolineaceae bacterium]
MALAQSIQLKIGKVHYNVSNLDRAAYFFEEGLGMKVLEKTHGEITLGTVDDQALLVLHKVNNPPPRKKTTGLFHLAIRLPSREDLARLVYHLVNNQVELEGIADHGVSEALYLTGPEEMGIELTSDRDSEDWPIDEEGQLEMLTEELDIDDLMMSIQGKNKKWTGLPTGTTIGHIHLRVAELETTAAFYTSLGFEITQAYGEQALFFASGEYHHHIGANTWQSAGASPLEADTAGLSYFEVVVPNQESIDKLANDLSESGLELNKVEDGILLVDPNGIQLKLVPAN